jgi:hypothetical protein
MKLTADRIVNAMAALVQIGRKGSIAIPGTAKFKLAKIHDRIMPHYKEIMKKQQELIQTYGEEKFSDPEKTKSTGQWTIPDENSENAKKFEAEWQAVLKEEFDIPLLTPVTLHMTGNETRGLELQDFVLLGELVVDPDEAKEA